MRFDEDKELAYSGHRPCSVHLHQFSRPSSWFGILNLYTCSDPDISVSVIACLLRAGPALSILFRLFVVMLPGWALKFGVCFPGGWRITWVRAHGDRVGMEWSVCVISSGSSVERYLFRA